MLRFPVHTRNKQEVEMWISDILLKPKQDKIIVTFFKSLSFFHEKIFIFEVFHSFIQANVQLHLFKECFAENVH